MDRLGASRVADALGALASRDEPAAAGAAAALCCSAAAALLELTAGLAAERLDAEGNRVGEAQAERLRGLGARAAEIRGLMPALADRDAALYAAVLAAPDAEARGAALAEASETPLAVAEAAAEVAEGAAQVVAAGSWPFTADARVACVLAAAAARAGDDLVTVNLDGEAGDTRIDRAHRALVRAERSCSS